MAIPDAVGELVERFRRGLAEYKGPAYNETQVRREFVDPLFDALGWDIQNRQGLPAGQKDVVHEDRVRVGRRQKAPDYGFYIGGARKFFVETKTPAANLHDDPAPAFQVRRYAWSAGLPVSILTDFEEFAVYDCRAEPRLSDDPYATRLFYWNFSQYPAVWDELAGRFGRAAVRDGALDQYAATLPTRRGTATVDAAFLREISLWREWLAQAIAAHQPDLTPRDLNFAVQMTIDRIVFLRIGEARGIEPEGALRELAADAGVYPRLLDAFRRADARYNSGLFHFSAERGRPEAPDTLTPALAIPDEWLRRIVGRLYYPDSPYAFDVIPVEILGQVYEQFLGKVIRLEAGRAVVEEKPEVRKAGGVYYTPTYIVDYIVRHTVGPLLAHKTPAQAAELRILDPACGSGSFLIGAYGYLLDWYLAQYLAAGPARSRRVLAEVPADTERHTPAGWRLTTEERKRILLAHIFGVDIDPQAVEVTKFSLLLKVLEGLATEQRQAGFERLLPDLGANVKCGNSLIGPDFYATGQASFLDLEEQLRINVFDWEAEFPAIMRAGGFDAVIGNPPYIRVHRLASQDKTYFWSHYSTFVAKSDIYACFIEKAIQLLRTEGRLSFITPNTWSSLESFTRLREHVLENSVLERMVRTPEKVFEDATVRTFIFVVRKELNPDVHKTAKALVLEMIKGGATHEVGQISHQDMVSAHLSNLLLHSVDAAPTLFAKCTQNGTTVGSVVEFYYGFKTGDDERFLAVEKLSETYKPFVRSAGVGRYGPLLPKEFVDYRPDVMKAHRSTARPGEQTRFERPKVVVARMGRELIATFDDTGIYVKDAMLLLSPTDDVSQLKTIVGLLNSRLMGYLYQNHFATIDVLKNALLALPLPKLDTTDNAVYKHEQLMQLVERLLALHRQAAAARTPTEKTALARQIAATDQQIDAQVYALYGLTEAEIALVERED